jgi:uncharacterized membrane protein
MIRRAIVAYLGAGLAFAGLDAVWLSFANAALYRPALHLVLATGFRPVPAVLFYLVYLLGVTVFATLPALATERWTAAPIKGAMFGFFAYATYDLTNQATLAVWATRVTVIDLMWGSFVTAVGATAGYFAGRLASRSGA